MGESLTRQLGNATQNANRSLILNIIDLPDRGEL